ncbi:MAG: carbohydrate ABC transporter substrate-binding protein [Ruminiclostridium sp.]|nr:carbohydrate ABC transporter substrate-binding protein [Ruminiclostridium sp.]
MQKKKIVAAVLSAAMITGMVTGCNGDNTTTSSAPETTTTVTGNPDAELESSVDWNDMANSGGEVDEADEAGTGELYEPGKKAGAVKALCYYDLAQTQPELAELLATRFGGTIETVSSQSGSLYFEKLATLVASDDSPDIVRYDWMAYPWGVSQNLFTPLDGWLDMDDPFWSDEKSVIESFAYAGKHYYFPTAVQTNFAMIYNTNNIELAGLEDPYELYMKGEWTWDTFERLATEWANRDEENIGFTGGSWSSMMFINTTGTKVIDMTGTDIVNNMKNENVQRTMDWIAKMKNDGLIGDGFIDPGLAFVDGKLLFLGMGLTWGFESAQQSLFKNDLPGEIVALPFPRDPQADKYYISADSYGFMVPAGAKNVQGGVQWILCGRIHETDPEIIQATQEELMYDGPNYFPKCAGCKYDFVESGEHRTLDSCPECNEPRKAKFKPVYSQEQIDINESMRDPEKFGLIFDSTVGFSSDFSDLFVGAEETIFDGPLYYGTSYTQLRDSKFGAVESYLEPIRQVIRQAASE